MGRTRTNNSKVIGREDKKQKSIDEMNKEVRNALGVIRKLLGDSDSQEAEAKYKVGRQVLAVQAKYGKPAVKMLIKESGSGKDLLYDAARVVKTWDEPAFAKLLQRKGSKGLPLSFSHFVKLSQEERPEVRAFLVRKVLEDGLSVDATANLVKSHRVKSGSKRKQPLHRELAQLEMGSQKLVERIGKVLTGLKKEETVASEVVSSLRKMAKLLGDASVQCATVAEPHEVTTKPTLESAEADAQHGDPQHEPQQLGEHAQPSDPQQHPQSEGQAQPSDPQQEQTQPEEQAPCIPESAADFLDVQKIDDPTEPQSEATAVERQHG